MAVQSTVRVLTLHHGAVPVGDVGRAYRFYSGVLGAKLNRLVNATALALQHGYPEIALLDVGGGLFGLALQYDAIPPPCSVGEGTVWGLEMGREQADRLAGELTRRGVSTAQPAPLPAACPMECMLAFQDPDGNTWELCVPREPAASGDAAMLRYASLEATDLRQAEEFYGGALGLACAVREPDLLAFAVGQNGTWLLVRKVEQMSPRAALIQGPHVAFAVDPASFDAAHASLPTREQYWERDTNRVPWPEPWQRVGYFYDPVYNRLALVVP